MTTIDVNLGGFDRCARNFDTRPTSKRPRCCRQLRLRNLNIIIIDFIDMDSNRHHETVFLPSSTTLAL